MYPVGNFYREWWKSSGEIAGLRRSRTISVKACSAHEHHFESSVDRGVLILSSPWKLIPGRGGGVWRSLSIVTLFRQRDMLCARESVPRTICAYERHCFAMLNRRRMPNVLTAKYVISDALLGMDVE